LDFIQQDVLEKFEMKEQNIVLNYSKKTVKTKLVFGGCRSDVDYGGGGELI
jgi:hypothetical protein